MAVSELSSLATVVRGTRDCVLALWRTEVRALPSAQGLDVPTLNDHIPALLEELARALHEHSDESIAEALRDGSPPIHGIQRLRDGFDINEVVAEYNILRGCIHNLACEQGINLQGQGFHILNRVLDGAIGLAVQSFAEQRALEVQQRREEYLAFVAHDLRTPLNAISLAANVLSLSGHAQSSPSGAQMLKSLHRNVRQLELLVNKVLEENSNLQADSGIKLHRRTCDLWPLVEALIVDLHPVAAAGNTQLVNEIPEDIEVFADAALLRRIMQNLLGNAISYTPNGTVRIGAELLPDGTATSCWVKDNGAGISPDILDSIFDKGLGDAERAGSTGLGLAIVKSFVEAHLGAVDAQSVEGQGTTISFTLPVPNSH